MINAIIFGVLSLIYGVGMFLIGQYSAKKNRVPVWMVCIISIAFYLFVLSAYLAANKIISFMNVLY